jgi:transcriptional regulator with PAS, ATPase and Fis domain
VALIETAAASRAPVCLTGETGTGKGVVARHIHYRSSRQAGPFININCAALPEQMIESELFGHERGAFTGAERRRKGVFEIAAGGSLLLDEIGTLPLHLQSKLLGVLDDGMVRRLGGEHHFAVDTRIIAATNIDLPKAIRERRFREDLYYRIGVVTIHLPPLRERRQDIPALCAHFIEEFGGVLELCLSEEEIARLQAYRWPGNVRELRNTMERAVILRDNRYLKPSRFLSNTAGTSDNPPSGHPAQEALLPLDSVIDRHIQNVLAHFGGNRTQAAQALGISRSTLKRKLKTFNSISEKL